MVTCFHFSPSVAPSLRLNIRNESSQLFQHEPQSNLYPFDLFVVEALWLSWAEEVVTVLLAGGNLDSDGGFELDGLFCLVLREDCWLR